ncbi:MAG: AmmeMemoRadiSam system radical SAM enzyme [Lentisphaerae bacterium RIFOXYB12_FULL_65_16]|nr:MAG: AmmeMemoRadiSam system radical SAM enzyme [Lentisphaerae bacterium RIFOXYA12_64_32]OGV88840.1 MAG: AmmeMemoRadiSam system radical SAM enzyme [Lentisphaerae bacterium RIFOXYB12_FULL_65_16]
MTVQCDLCPKRCVIEPNQSGDCRIRVNLEGKLCAVTYGFASAVHVDPVEKKPVYHYLPGTPILSLATVGCNLHCKNCQNWEISQCNPEDSRAAFLPPADVVALAKKQACPSIAYTYTEPLVYYEYTLDCARLAREQGIKNVLVTAGYINPEPLRELCRYVDAATVDVKAFSNEFYQDMCGATLKPVLDGLVLAKSCGVMVEVSNLVIPTLNDTDRDFLSLCTWLKENMGPETPLHFLRFFPHYRMRNLPPTEESTMARAREIARAVGLHYVYVGNILLEGSATTCCPSCKKVLVRRQGFVIQENRLRDGRCPDCNREIYGLWR